ncbi:DNA-binding protein with HTH domain [Burkholderiales bacterium JOSHI_001]|nr:DNA-binding protein with HTH domain [Burkholderiales bacterium JOSHI_001]
MKPNPNHRPPMGQHRRPSAGARRVLKWLVQGHDLAAIAHRLGRNEQNLKQRLAAMFARLGVDSPQAALDALSALHPQQTGHAQGHGGGTEAQASQAPSDEFADVDVGESDEPPVSEAAAGTTTE